MTGAHPKRHAPGVTGNRTIALELEPAGLKPLFALAGGGTLTYGEWLPAPGGARVMIPAHHGQRDLGPTGPIVVSVLLSIPAGVAVNLLSSWLTEKLRGRARRLRIDRTEVEIEEGEIRRVLRERIELDE